MSKEEYRISPTLIEQDPKKRLEVDLFGTKLPSPLILGSGTLVEKQEQMDPYLLAGAGAVVPRTTRKVMTRQVHPSPHLYQTGHRGKEMMLNAEWTGADIEYWRPNLERLAETKQVIMSISGRDIPGCIEVCKTLDQYHWPYLEINVGCAHSNSHHGFITRNGDHIRKLVDSIKSAGVQTPIAIKLGHSDLIVPLAEIAKEAGADAIVAINTYGPLFDFDIGQGGVANPVLGIGGAKGGMSGKPLFNIALTDIAEISYQVGIPAIGCGGVSTAEDVIKMMMAGAAAVQIYTAAHVRGINAPQFFTQLNGNLIAYMDKKGIETASLTNGKALSLLSQETNLDPLIPEFHSENCTGCQKCMSICLPRALTGAKTKNVVIEESKCIGCGHCTSVCPTQALTMKERN